MFVLKRLLIISVATMVIVCCYMALFEDQFIYFPSRELDATPAEFGMQHEELLIATDGELTLCGWYMPVPLSTHAVIHFHGNAGNISHRLSLYRRWQAMGLSVYAIDYRGYGRSEGEPSEAGLYEDARAAWRDATMRLGLKPNSIIIAGRSLGAAVAAKLATEVQAAGVVLETPFSNIPDMAAHHYPWLPLRFLAGSRYDTKALVHDIHQPLLLIAARNDTIAPPQMAEAIFQEANEPKQKIELAGDHNDFDDYSSAAYKQAWQSWLSTL